MWVLDTETLKVQELHDSRATEYAILSHTWEPTGEVNFQDLVNLEAAKEKPGFDKVHKTCEIALAKKIRHAWVDTCCIDKTSSAELSEAINSMFRWYQDAYVCYVYLSDFDPIPDTVGERERLSTVHKQLGRCKWFTRGWTLQELIAPKKMDFFDRDWNLIGGKKDLVRILSDITKIDASILLDSSGLYDVPVARKMSWASGRQTRRPEDRAYSLLGIFDINMPMLYGEGSKAFLRLQQQIASGSNDMSLFAWKFEPGSTADCPQFSGLFANSPDDFSHCSTLKRQVDQTMSGREFTITNAGLRISDSVLHKEAGCEYDKRFRNCYILPLDCIDTGARAISLSPKAQWLGVRLVGEDNTFLRYMPNSIETTEDRWRWRPWWPSSKRHWQDIYIQTIFRPDEERRIRSLLGTGIKIIYSRIISEELILEAFPKASTVPLLAQAPARGRLRNAFTFHPQGRDNFLGIQPFYVDPSRKELLLIVCSLQWITGEYKLRYRLLDEANYIVKMWNRTDDWNRSDEAKGLKEAKDHLLLCYSDDSGNLVQELMPVSRKVSKGEVRLVEVNHPMDLPEGYENYWTEGFHHILVEASLSPWP